MIARTVTVEHHRNGQLILIEGVPTRVCQHCGEQYFDAAVIEDMEATASDDSTTLRTVAVPVKKYKPLSRQPDLAVEAVAALLSAPDWKKWTKLLVQVGEVRVVKALSQIMATANEVRGWSKREMLVDLLSHLKQPDAIEELMFSLYDENWHMQWIAAKALGRLGDMRAVGYLKEFLGDEEAHAEVLSVVGEALRQLQPSRQVAAMAGAVRERRVHYVVKKSRGKKPQRKTKHSRSRKG